MPESRPLPARSLSVALLPAPVAPRQLRVLSVHRRVLNLEDDDGRILALVFPEVGDGPFHIVLDRPISFDVARPGMAGQWQADDLTVGALHITLARAQHWDPTLTAARIPAQSLTALRACVQATDAFQQRWQDMDRNALARMQMGAALLARGVRTGDESARRKAVSLLVGLGPGLTPAGDDYLLGALARLQLDVSLPDVDLLAPHLDAAVRITTRLSRAWLQAAVCGQFDAHWHALRSALVAGKRRDLCRAATAILDVGASSGPMAMAGFLLV